MNRNSLVRTKHPIPTKNKNKSTQLRVVIKTVRQNLVKKYFTDESIYYKKLVNEIVYNEKSHVVAKFKDYLIYDDMSEFLKRFYKLEETMIRLSKIAQFYLTFSKIFPNYVILNEAKYIYKNIQRKQKMINNLHRNNNKNEKKKLEDEKVFDTNIIDSIMNQTQSQNYISTTENVIKVAYNNQISENVNIFDSKKETSYLSIERLIQTLDKVESPLFINKKPISNTISSPSMPQRDKTKGLLSPIRKIKKENTPIDMTRFKLKTCSNLDNNEIKNTDNTYLNSNVNTTNVNTHVKINNLVSSGQNSILNKVLVNEEKKMFETNLLHRKYREIKKKYKISSDISNITAFKDRIKKDLGSTLTTAYQGSSILSNEKLFSKNNNNEVPDTLIINKITDGLNCSTNNPLCGSRSTKNLFNPATTPIKNIEVKEGLNTLKENLNKTEKKVNLKLVLKINDKNVRKFQNLKPEILNTLNKNKNAVTLTINRESFLNNYKKQINTKFNSISNKATPTNELRHSTPCLTARQVYNKLNIR